MYRLNLLFVLFLFPIGVSQLHALANCECAQKNWQPALEPRGITNGYRQGVGGELVVPAFQNRTSLFFGQTLAGRFQDEWVGSIGLGYRRLLPSCLWAWGVNGFIDGALADCKTYGQGGIGAELFGPCIEGRINGYLPFTRAKGIEHHTEEALGLAENALIHHTDSYSIRERTYAGFDVEAGYGRDIFCGSIWGYAGYYYFSTQVLENIHGPRIRLVYRYDGLLSSYASQLIAGLLYEYDAVHGNRVGVEIGIRIPLGYLAQSACCSPSSLYRRMGNRVVRQEGILKKGEWNHSSSEQAPVLTAKGAPREVFFVHNGGIGKGTSKDLTTLTDALERADPEAVIVLSRVMGDIETSGITLKKGQHLIGFGESGNAYLQGDGLFLKMTDKAGRVALIGPANGSVLTLADRSRVSGITVKGGIVGVSGQGVAHVVLSDIRITDAKNYGIELTSVENARLDQIAMSHIGDWLLKADKVSNLHINRMTATERVDNGIWVKNGNAPLIKGLYLELGGDEGLRIGATSNLTLLHSFISGEESSHKLDYGIYLTDVTSARLDGITLKGVDGYALIGERSVDIEIKACHIQTKADEAIRIVEGQNLRLLSSHIVGGKETLVTLSNTTGVITLSDNVFEGAQAKGRGAVEFTSLKKDPTTFTFCRNKICDCLGEGLKLDVKGAFPLNLNFSHNTLTTLGGTGFRCLQNGAEGQIIACVDGNTFTEMKRGILLSTGSYASGSAFIYTIDGNTFSNMREEGVFITHEAFSKKPAVLSGRIADNYLNRVQGAAISLFSDLSKGPDHLFLADVCSNTVSEGAKEAALIQIDRDSGGDVHLKLKGNRDIDGGGRTPYVVDIGQNYVGHAALIESDNTSDRGEGVTVSDKGCALSKDANPILSF